LQAYKNGLVQGINQITPDILEAALKEPNLAIYSGRLPELGIVFLNLDHPEATFFQDANIRRALYMAVNRQYIIDKILNGQGIQADGPIFPGTWAYYDGTPHVELNAERAKQLLDEAGFPVDAVDATKRTSKDQVACNLPCSTLTQRSIN